MPADSAGWKIKKESLGRVYEGLELATVQEWVLEGRVDPTDPIFPPGSDRWRPAGEVKELVRYFAPAQAGIEAISGADVGFSFRSRRDSEEEDGIDMTPFIDIVFNLLLFFIITAQFSHRGLKVELPETSSGAAIDPGIAVDVDQAGRIHFEGESDLTFESLRIRVGERLRQSGKRLVTIRGDQAAPYGVVAKAMDACKLAGAEKIDLPTEVRRKGR